MPAIRVFVVKVVRHKGPEGVLGVVESVSPPRRQAFRTAGELWDAVAGPGRRGNRAATEAGSPPRKRPRNA